MPRSSRLGAVRETTSSLATTALTLGMNAASIHASATAPADATATIATERNARAVEPCSVAETVARIGVITGAISMAPITTAVESAATPNVAMVADSPIRTANRNRRLRPSSPSRNNAASTRCRSAWFIRRRAR